MVYLLLVGCMELRCMDVWIFKVDGSAGRGRPRSPGWNV